NGTKGKLIAKLPLEWHFRRDPYDSGIVRRWPVENIDLTTWNTMKAKGPLESHMHSGSHWEMLRTDLYAQAQGVLHPDYNYYNGYAWYRCDDVEIDPAAASGKPHLRFTGLFNECWLYVNGNLVA